MRAPIWEDVWATKFAEAVRDAVAELLLEGARIPHELIASALESLPAAV